jgi:hypothetical protein
MISVGWFLAFTRIVRFGFRGFLENGISFGFGSREYFQKLKIYQFRGQVNFSLPMVLGLKNRCLATIFFF